MSIAVTETVRLITRIIGQNQTLYANTWYLQLQEAGGISDATCLNDFTEWLNALFAPLSGRIDSQNAWGECQVDVVEVTGVYDPDPEINTARVSVVRPVGFVVPGITFGAAGEEYTGIATLVITPKCVTNYSRPRKSISGFTEGFVLQGLCDNALVASGILVGVNWVLGPTPLSTVATEWWAGTLSMKLGLFTKFNGTFDVAGALGTMVTRKVGRGS